MRYNIAPLQPTRVVCDFERAIRNAVIEELDLEEIDGCYFHLRKLTVEKMKKYRYGPIFLTLFYYLTKIDFVASSLEKCGLESVFR